MSLDNLQLSQFSFHHIYTLPSFPNTAYFWPLFPQVSLIQLIKPLSPSPTNTQNLKSVLKRGSINFVI